MVYHKNLHELTHNILSLYLKSGHLKLENFTDMYIDKYNDVYNYLLSKYESPNSPSIDIDGISDFLRGK